MRIETNQSGWALAIIDNKVDLIPFTCVDEVVSFDIGGRGLLPFEEEDLVDCYCLPSDTARPWLHTVRVLATSGTVEALPNKDTVELPDIDEMRTGIAEAMAHIYEAVSEEVLPRLDLGYARNMIGTIAAVHVAWSDTKDMTAARERITMAIIEKQVAFDAAIAEQLRQKEPSRTLESADARENTPTP